MARGYTALGQGWLSLDRGLLLPDFADPAKKAWRGSCSKNGYRPIVRSLEKYLPQLHAARTWTALFSTDWRDLSGMYA